MDGFSYYNIFDTKGIEYLAVIAFLLLLIPFWLILNKKLPMKERINRAIGILSFNKLKIPQGIYYSRNHTWAFLEKSGTARMGLDDLLVHITGDVKVRHLKSKGDLVRKGELIAEIDQNGKSLGIFSPMSGKILKSNPELLENHALLKDDPYGKGWIYNLKPTQWQAETPDYYLAEEGTEWLKKEMDRYKDFLAINLSRYTPGNKFPILQDGGEIAENSLSALPGELWHDFQKEFLNP